MILVALIQRVCKAISRIPEVVRPDARKFPLQFLSKARVLAKGRKNPIPDVLPDTTLMTFEVGEIVLGQRSRLNGPLRWHRDRLISAILRVGLCPIFLNRPRLAAPRLLKRIKEASAPNRILENGISSRGGRKSYRVSIPVVGAR